MAAASPKPSSKQSKSAKNSELKAPSPNPSSKQAKSAKNNELTTPSRNSSPKQSKSTKDDELTAPLPNPSSKQAKSGKDYELTAASPTSSAKPSKATKDFELAAPLPTSSSKPSKKVKDYENFDKLRGSENYIRWRFQMQKLLLMQNLWCSIGGFPTKDTTSARAKRRMNQVALAKILSMVERPCSQVLKKIKSADHAWHTLENEYAEVELIRKLNVLNDICILTPEMFDQPVEFEREIKFLCKQFAILSRPFDEKTFDSLNAVDLPPYYDSILDVVDRCLNNITNELIITKLSRPNVVEQLNRINRRNQSNQLNQPNQSNRRNKAKKRNNQAVAGPEDLGTLDEAKALSPEPVEEQVRDNLPYRLYIQNSIEDPAQEYNNWYVDCGSTNHVTFRSDWLQNFRLHATPIQVVSSDPIVPGVGMGNVSFWLEPGVSKEVLTIHDVALVPQSTANILSICCLLKEGYQIELNKDVCTITHNGRSIKAIYENKHFKIKSRTFIESD